MTSTLSTARPPRAAIAWATKDAIFVEIPCRDGPPYIARYHRTAEGLAAALNVICDKPERATRNIQRSHPTIKFGPKLVATDAERASLREVLRKRGIT